MARDALVGRPGCCRALLLAVKPLDEVADELADRLVTVNVPDWDLEAESLTESYSKISGSPVAADEMCVVGLEGQLSVGWRDPSICERRSDPVKDLLIAEHRLPPLLSALDGLVYRLHQVSNFSLTRQVFVRFLFYLDTGLGRV